MKYLIITIDTEGDNLWEWHEGAKICTENSLYLTRFQNLCNKYGFKPVWLTNYEMISDDRYVDFIQNVEKDGKGELGMHLHAWNSPPIYNLPVVQKGAPYLIEYPLDIMDKKIQYLTNTIEKRTGIRPVSHRAGRWAINQEYFDLLMKYGYKVDCSITPHINWESSVGRSKGVKGPNYEDYPDCTYRVISSTNNNSMLEVPVTVKRTHKYLFPDNFSVRKAVGNVIRAFHGQNVWIRPNGSNLKQMIALLEEYRNSDMEYVMFMLHSSELMPGGSPTFKSSDAIEKLYTDLEKLFSFGSKYYIGITLREYEKKVSDNI